MRWIDERLPLAAARLQRGRRRLSGAAQPQLFLEFRRPRRASRWCIQIVTGIVLAMHYAANGASRVQLGRAHHARRQPGLVAALRARQRRELLLHRHLHPHLPRPLLRLVQGAARDGVAARPGHLPADDGDRVHGLCASLGADELLGRQGDHRPVRRRSRWSASRSRNGCSAASRPTTPRSTASSRSTICCRS